MPRGRPREFDTKQALQLAMETFWRQGYRATSLDDLTKAMGITRPSLYAAFGGKEQLFLKTIDCYIQQFGAEAIEALEREQNSRLAVKAMLSVAANQLSNPSLPTGCLRVNSTLECQANSPAIRDKLISLEAGFEAALHQRLVRSQADGQLSDQVDALALARFYAAVINGMSVMARVNRDAHVLQQIVDTAMLAWTKQGT